jgi:hypothetical protein
MAANQEVVEAMLAWRQEKNAALGRIFSILSAHRLTAPIYFLRVCSDVLFQIPLEIFGVIGR